MRLGLVVVMGAACGRVGFDPLPAGDGSSASHGYRRRITVTGNDPVAVSYLVRVPLALDPSHTLPSYADVRVLVSPPIADELGLDRFVDVAAPVQGTSLWFPLTAGLASGESSEYWLYYGDSTLLGPSDPSKVFLLYDAFASLASTWLVNGLPEVAGTLVLPPGDTAITTNAASAGVPAAAVIEVSAKISNPSGPGNYYWWGFQHTGDFGTGAPFLNWVGGSSGTGMDADISGWVNAGSVNSSALAGTQDTATHRYRIERGPESTAFFRDGALTSSALCNDSTVYSVQLRNQSTNNVVTIDWVRVRPLVNLEPTVTVDAEEPL